MAKLSMENLLKKDLKIVEKKRLFFIIPLAFLLAGIIAAISYGFALGSPFNLGMDFTGGYVITVRAGNTINDNNYQEYSKKIEGIINDYRFEYEGKEYPVVFGEIQKLGSKTETSLRIQYRAHKSLPNNRIDSIMEELNEDLVKTLNDVVGVWSPNMVDRNGNTAIVHYDLPVKVLVESGTLKQVLADNGVTATDIQFVNDADGNPDYHKIVFNFTGDFDGKTDAEITDALESAATIEMYFAAKATAGEMIGGSVRMDLIYNAILAIIITLVLMLIYIFIRFEFASGVAAVIALVHDVVIMFVLMTIMRIEINSTFIAVVITLLAYSINNTIIIFDRVRENRKAFYSAGTPATATLIANKSIKETFTRNVYTTLTTIIMIGMIAVVCAIGGITSMVTFALPIIFGLLAGFYSSLCIAPSLWVMFKRDDAGMPTRSSIFRSKNTAAESTLKNN